MMMRINDRINLSLAKHRHLSSDGPAHARTVPRIDQYDTITTGNDADIRLNNRRFRAGRINPDIFSYRDQLLRHGSHAFRVGSAN